MQTENGAQAKKTTKKPDKKDQDLLLLIHAYIKRLFTWDEDNLTLLVWLE